MSKSKSRPRSSTGSPKACAVEEIRISLNVAANVILGSDRATSRAIGIVRQSGLDRKVQRRIITELQDANNGHQSAINMMGTMSAKAISAGVWR